MDDNNKKNRRILIIDDNKQIHQDFKKILVIGKEKEADLDEIEKALLGETKGLKIEEFVVDCAFQGEEGLKMVEESLERGEPYSVAFVDVRMPPGWDGIKTISSIWKVYKDLQIVICTAYSDYSWKGIVEKFGYSDKLFILKKPFDNIEVRQLACALTEKWELTRIANLNMSELERNVAVRTKELMESEEKYRTMIDYSNDMIWTLDREGNFLYSNKKSEEITGHKINEGVGKIFDPLIFEEDLEKVKNVFKETLKGKSNHYEVRIYKSNNEILFLSVNTAPIYKDGNVIGTVSFGRDITERRKMEEELLKASKLESIGILAGGIAHDFNNILTGIIGNISIAKMYVSSQDKVYDVLTKMEGASFQAKNLTHQLLTFAKGGAPVKKATSIKALIEDSTIFALRGSNVKPEFSFAKDLWNVEVDRGQISEVINNLIINANQAMPDGGVINVYAENVHASKGDVLPIGEGKYVKIVIEDKGIGIPEEYLQKIFDPFFTTKQEGSGLGLSTTYSIIKKHDGYIDVKSDIGKGASFYIYLPASEREVLRFDNNDFESIRRGTGRVLVMDDEELVRNVAREMLEMIGYEVEFARDGLEALEKYRLAKGSGKVFDCVILDLTVPGGMGGRELIKELIKIDSGVKAIVSSGYSNDPIMGNYRDYGFSGVVPKPYKIKELSKVLYGVVKNLKDVKENN